MDIFSDTRARILAALQDLAPDGAAPLGAADPAYAPITVEPPRDPSHGDLASNAAMVLAKTFRRKPRDIAEALAPVAADWPHVTAVEIAGPGFLNLRLADQAWHHQLAAVLADGPRFGDRPAASGAGPVNVEYVSANPTGPLHVGHCRGAVFGDALARLLEKAGHKVTREYYINDAGGQVDVLARSAYLRYREALGEAIGEIPAGLYPGDYLIAAGRAIAAEEGDRWLQAAEADWLPVFRARSIEMMMEVIRDDLAALDIRHDVFSSEAQLHADGRVEAAIAALEADGYVYTGVLEPPKGKLPDDWEPRPQLLFKASAFGDDTDRPLKKSDGSWTYFAADIAYHYDKIQRGFDHLIDVWGADHGGYVARVAAAVAALTGRKDALDVKLCQLVNLLEGGQPVKVSKRAGTFVTLREIVDRVGPDVVRFIMLTRKNDAPLDFDFARVLEQSKDNPVFYVQYAHARVHSVLRNAAVELDSPELADAAQFRGLQAGDLAALTHPGELDLIKRMAAWPRLVDAAAQAHEPHRVAFYLYDLAAAFHAHWNAGKDDPSLRFIHAADRPLTLARLALLRGVADVIASGLDVLGVTPVTEMR
ncbi:arginine--tRNA ligase [Marinibaculum pumilum]|uniref:Arginine--tRNA ligase n=1 Tax=Marinibaculum pumilum TaxID=1766165 RepID=A0ABV7KWN5_9PROT